MAAYLDNISTLEDAIKWLEAETGETWTLGRLLDDACVVPFVWLDYAPDAPAEIFGDRIEGYLAPILFNGDTQRLAADKTTVIMTMTTTHDGKFIQITPGLRFTISELRFKREDLLREAAKVGAGETVSEAKETPRTNKKTWDDDKLRALWSESLQPDATQDSLAQKHGVSRQRISKLLKKAKVKLNKTPVTENWLLLQQRRTVTFEK